MKNFGGSPMKKLIFTLACVLGIGVITTHASAQTEDTDDAAESILNHTPISEEANWLIALTEGSAEVEEESDALFESILEADTYLAFSSFFSAPEVTGSDTEVTADNETTTFTLSMVHEESGILEVERYSTDAMREITSPQAYVNSVNGEMYLYNTSTGSFEDVSFSGFTYDDIMIERYNNVYANLEDNLEEFVVYENVDYFIFVGSEIDGLETQFLNQSGWTTETLVENSFLYEYIILVNKETSLIEYNGLMTSGESTVDNQNYISEHYTYYYDVDVYDDLDVMHEENAFEAAPDEVESNQE